MATKVTGLAQTTLSVADSGSTLRDIRNALTNWQVSTPHAVQDVTGIDKSAIERLPLLADVSMTLNGVFDTLATSGAHAVFSTTTSSPGNRAVNITTNGKNLNFTGILFTDYQITRAASGELTFQVPGVLGDGATPTWS